jgi:hypothetical protein
MSFFQEGCTAALNQVLLPLPTPAELNMLKIILSLQRSTELNQQ